MQQYTHTVLRSANKFFLGSFDTICSLHGYMRVLQPINRPWTDDVHSFPNRPAHGPLNNWQSCLFYLLRQIISKGYFAF